MARELARRSPTLLDPCLKHGGDVACSLAC
jgi:hypothetical protein